MDKIEFTEEEKVKMFDEIAKCFFNRNFGTMSKADMELLMFHFYIDQWIQEHAKADGTLDYSACSDYSIGKELGLTPQKVRNLKIKKQLIYPSEDFDWKKSFLSVAKNARYVDKRVVLNIPDPNLYLEIKEDVEKRGAYVEMQFNNSILQLRPEYYIDLLLATEEDAIKEKIIRELKKDFKKQGLDDRRFDEKCVGHSFIENGVKIAGVLASVVGFFANAGGLATDLLNFLA